MFRLKVLSTSFFRRSIQSFVSMEVLQDSSKSKFYISLDTGKSQTAQLKVCLYLMPTPSSLFCYLQARRRCCCTAWGREWWTCTTLKCRPVREGRESEENWPKWVTSSTEPPNKGHMSKRPLQRDCSYLGGQFTQRVFLCTEAVLILEVRLHL